MHVNTTNMGRVATIEARLMRKRPITITISNEVPTPTNPIKAPPNNPTNITVEYDLLLYLMSIRAPLWWIF